MDICDQSSVSFHTRAQHRPEVRAAERIKIGTGREAHAAANITMNKFLVTGANGFIGSHVVDQLLARGNHVRCLVRRSSQRPWMEGRDVELVEGDIAVPPSLTRAVAGCDAVIHLAGLTCALNKNDFLATNAQGVRHVAAACAAQETPPVLVVVSSLAAAGPATHGRANVESDPPRPVSNYGQSKLAGEQEAAAMAGKLPISIVRPPIVVGPRDRLSFALFRPIARWGVHVVPGFTERRFSVVHATDLASALLSVAERGARLPALSNKNGAPPQTGQGFYYVAASEQPTYEELGHMIAAALGRPRARRVRLPETVVWATGGMTELTGRLLRRPLSLSLDKVREAVAGNWTCDAARIRDELGFTPAAPLADRLRATAEWYREAGWL